jgi:hypothetical protein
MTMAAGAVAGSSRAASMPAFRAHTSAPALHGEAANRLINPVAEHHGEQEDYLWGV